MSPRTLRLSVVSAAFVALASVSACGTPAGPEADAAGAWSLSEVSYALGWDLSGVSVGDGWTVESDEGFAVTLDTGWAVTLQATLAPCEDEGDAVAGLTAVSPAMATLLAPRPARADHPDFFDASLVETSVAEDLAQPRRIELGRRSFTSGSYCGVFWVVGRSESGTWSPERTAIERQSLALSGRWSRGDASGVFDFATNWPNGMRWELDELLGDQTGCRAEVTFVRSAGRLFDEIDFEADSDQAIAWQVLQNLVEGAAPTVTLTECTESEETP